MSCRRSPELISHVKTGLQLSLFPRYTTVEIPPDTEFRLCLPQSESDTAPRRSLLQHVGGMNGTLKSLICKREWKWDVIPKTSDSAMAVESDTRTLQSKRVSVEQLSAQ